MCTNDLSAIYLRNLSIFYTAKRLFYSLNSATNAVKMNMMLGDDFPTTMSKLTDSGSLFLWIEIIEKALNLKPVEKRHYYLCEIINMGDRNKMQQSYGSHLEYLQDKAEIHLKNQRST